MKRAIYILYFICAACCLFFFVYLCAGVHDDVFQARESMKYEQVTADGPKVVHAPESKTVPVGVKTEYIIRQLDIPKGGACLMFYSIHQGVEVYIGDELVYRLAMSEDNVIGKTPGNNWNTIPIYPEDAGKEIKIVLTPAYESSVNIVPDFYFGSEAGIRESIVKQYMPSFVLALLAVISGIAFILFAAFTCRETGADKSLIMMGMFSIMLGVWKMTDIKSTAFIFPYSIARSNTTFLALLLLVVPYVLYVKKFFTRRSWLWYVPYAVSIAVTAVSLLLQVFNIADLRQTMWINHLLMGMVLIIAIVMLVQELYCVGWNRQLKLVAFCMITCVIGMPIDMGSYYLSNKTRVSFMGMFGFLIYIIVLGISSMREAWRVMALGKKAKTYQQMAYHDQLTGLFNRAAYAEDIVQAEADREQCVLAMFDLNDLKRCNDTWGHDKGDSYIVNSARMIQSVFGSIGKCYRMGGDEFCVILKNISGEACGELIGKLYEETDSWNEKSGEVFKIEIAGGYARFDSELDFDLNDTLRRADKSMYREKFRIKLQG